VSGYPVQPSKVQRPPLRDETLARDRLLDWLHAKVHHRVVYVIAEAGYGKTTLLADFSRRTRFRTLWYRLDDEDRSWVAFLSHLVAAGAELDPDFAPATRGLLRELATSSPSLESVLDTFVRELQTLGEAGAVLILDDFHAVDDAPDIQVVMRALITRAPERVTLLIASRRAPSLPVARLRGQGEVAELVTDDLRFSESETEQLFRETYGRPLDLDVVNDLSRRTEGWAASLQLVQAAIRGRSAGEVRSFVRSLSGAEGDLYDYLAEEVIGTLPADLQHFLLRVSLLHDFEPTLLQAVSGRSRAEVVALSQAGERCGLVIRGDRGHRARRGFHPLVRQFLVDRLERDVGPSGVADLHRAAARAAKSWKVACYHYAQASDSSALLETLTESVGAVLGGGDFTLAAQYVRAVPGQARSAAAAMILSRAEIQAGRPHLGVALAAEAHQIGPSALTAVNLGSVLTVTGDLRRASDVLKTVDGASLDWVTRDIAAGLQEVMQLSIDGDLKAFVGHMEAMVDRHIESGLVHYAGISLLNAATALRAQGEALMCFDYSTRAVEALTASSARSELISARLVRDWALAHLGRDADVWDPVDETADLSVDTRAEAVAEAATSALWYGEAEEAERLLSLVDPARLTRSDMVDIHRVASLELAIRCRRLDDAAALAAKVSIGEFSSEPGHQAHQLAARSSWAIATKHPAAPAMLRDALMRAESQGAWFWVTYCELLSLALVAPNSGVRLPQRAVRDCAYLSVLAELVVDILARLGEPDLDVVTTEARARPLRWRQALRRVAAEAHNPSRWRAADMLDEIGDASDVSLLRQLAKTARAGSGHRSLGRALARRLAPRVFIQDQGRVHLEIGNRRVEGTALRRKVLALLTFLLTRPYFSATRDEVLDSLWPDLEPEVAVNSLNQTVYFLRRVFEPDYSEQTSPGFVHFDSNVIWLDHDLVDSRSAACQRILRDMGSASEPARVLALAGLYQGRFALDFAYEEWAIPFRDSLHAAYLHAIESCVSADTSTGHYDRGIHLARAALDVDPAADGLEASLVRLYRMSGAHAAAAEQYEHYAAVVRDELGVEPPALEAL
jgi:DNA-binding SARP family transcriptional activator